MSRRSGRKSAIASYAETPDREIEKGVVEIDEEVSQETVIKKQGGKPAAVKKETDSATVNGKTEVAKPSKPTTAKRKGVHQDDDISPPPKRKIKAEEEDSHDEKTITKAAKKPVKKRKTKEETENDAMPVAARTAVATLKRKMYIGAHISAAGGTSPYPLSPYQSKKGPANSPFPRRPKLPPKCSTHRRQQLRALPQIAAQMVLPPSRRGCHLPIPVSQQTTLL